MGIKAEVAFNVIDKDDKAYITVADVRDFIQRQNMYPTDKSLKLLFERFDKDGGGTVCFDEYQQAVTPFLTGLNQNEE